MKAVQVSIMLTLLAILAVICFSKRVKVKKENFDILDDLKAQLTTAQNDLQASQKALDDYDAAAKTFQGNATTYKSLLDKRKQAEQDKVAAQQAYSKAQTDYTTAVATVKDKQKAVQDSQNAYYASAKQQPIINLFKIPLFQQILTLVFQLG